MYTLNIYKILVLIFQLVISDSKVLGTLLWASPVRSLRYLHQLESAKKCYKSYISLQFNTPPPTKLLALAKKRFQRLFFLPGNCTKYNWLSQVKHIISKIDTVVHIIFNSPFNSSTIGSIIQKYSSIGNNHIKINNSLYFQLYKTLNI